MNRLAMLMAISMIADTQTRVARATQEKAIITMPAITDTTPETISSHLGAYGLSLAEKISPSPEDPAHTDEHGEHGQGLSGPDRRDDAGDQDDETENSVHHPPRTRQILAREGEVEAERADAEQEIANSTAITSIVACGHTSATMPATMPTIEVRTMVLRTAMSASSGSLFSRSGVSRERTLRVRRGRGGGTLLLGCTADGQCHADDHPDEQDRQWHTDAVTVEEGDRPDERPGRADRQQLPDETHGDGSHCQPVAMPDNGFAMNIINRPPTPKPA